ncbi:hypothetical protein ELQ92_08415 [Labedella populi]|uniref:Uncharacterized protein n=1 Tax=Labedella populi TaxID=2498850 RepID=A0A3S4E6Y4_9MICO|nr:hypothetical protein [Labedella populi]RWZ64739.1 hypothetical protein ELQ92_08415 [Labedella populi]
MSVALSTEAVVRGSGASGAGPDASGVVSVPLSAAAAAAAASFAALRRAAAAFAAADRTGSGVRFGPPEAGLRVDPLERGDAEVVAGSTTASRASEDAAAEERRLVEGVDADFVEEDDVLREDFEVRAVDDVDRAGDFFFGAPVLPVGAAAGVCSEWVDGVWSSSF